jgi:2',3'-cyclic-nucleotide 2'-phosphodiesterase (5'-nucleotidase family)
VHGLKFAYDSERQSGDRIVFALAEKNKAWQELQPQSTYRIGMTDYSFKGGEGYQFPDAKNIKYTDLKLNEYLKSYLLQRTLKSSPTMATALPT